MHSATLIMFAFFTGLVGLVTWLIARKQDHESSTGYFLAGRSEDRGQGRGPGRGAGQTATFHVYMTRPAEEPVTVQYATQDGTAEAGTDYRTATTAPRTPGPMH